MFFHRARRSHLLTNPRELNRGHDDQVRGLEIRGNEISCSKGQPDLVVAWDLPMLVAQMSNQVLTWPCMTSQQRLPQTTNLGREHRLQRRQWHRLLVHSGACNPVFARQQGRNRM